MAKLWFYHESAFQISRRLESGNRCGKYFGVVLITLRGQAEAASALDLRFYSTRWRWGDGGIITFHVGD
jgi:hypothetical protein